MLFQLPFQFTEWLNWISKWVAHAWRIPATVRVMVPTSGAVMSEQARQPERTNTSERTLQLIQKTAADNKHAHGQRIATAGSRENRNSCSNERRTSSGGRGAPSTHASRKIRMASRRAPEGLGNPKLNGRKTSKHKSNTNRAKLRQVKHKSSKVKQKSSKIRASQARVKHESSNIATSQAQVKHN